MGCMSVGSAVRSRTKPSTFPEIGVSLLRRFPKLGYPVFGETSIKSTLSYWQKTCGLDCSKHTDALGSEIASVPSKTLGHAGIVQGFTSCQEATDNVHLD